MVVYFLYWTYQLLGSQKNMRSYSRITNKGCIQRYCIIDTLIKRHLSSSGDWQIWGSACLTSRLRLNDLLTKPMKSDLGTNKEKEKNQSWWNNIQKIWLDNLRSDLYLSFASVESQTVSRCDFHFGISVSNRPFRGALRNVPGAISLGPLPSSLLLSPLPSSLSFPSPSARHHSLHQTTSYEDDIL